MNREKVKKYFIFLVLMLPLIIFWRPTAQTTPNTSSLTVGNTKISVEIAKTPAELTRGLSGRTDLAENFGLFFIFPYADTHGIWMKEMNFPIDIIWLDENFQIIAIKENAKPDSYPEVFTPTTPALYVLEIPVNFVQKHKIFVGKTIKFKN
ncbi:MAG: hypothetical protein UX06_C0007G0008 [Candidatus Giovannonibacteria bacterium GW2011_GWA2_45_21]|uniref:DUF192 domain-containing protein n=1 Tax=Candidatus Giovannonibacteria bacterium GW2011_GWA2_45_21 TaxID=1618649 RepID=A0A0G1PHF5_9BACT|nr:MAG: hypothetical protein UX06_C0007G0008 [Candidatus Giovannonibacteria bacterium GW2011_GWA2_45_21]